MHNYCEVNGTFPPAFVADSEGRPAHSWRVLLLPYVDGKKLYSQYRFDESWDSPHNSALADKIPTVYRCPSFVKYHKHHGLDSAHSLRLTNYVAISVAGSVLDGAHPTSIAEIHDGTSHTLVISEARQHAVHWMQPDDVTPTEMFSDLKYTTSDDHANHISGMHVLFADGGVRFLSIATSLERLRALISRDGGESVDLD